MAPSIKVKKELKIQGYTRINIDIYIIYIYIYTYVYQLDKACFEHDMAYGDYKDLNGRTAADKYYVKKHLILLNIQNMIDINVDLLR